MSTQTHLVDLPRGGEVAFQILEHDRDEDGLTTSRLEITGPDERRWRIRIVEDLEQGSDDWDIELISSYNSDGELADVDLPNWLDEVLMRLR